MRLLHTSDWHLGQNFFGFSRHYEHQQFLDWLLLTLVEQQIDVLLIAGDVFDTANAPASAQQQLYQFLCAAKLNTPHLQVVIIAGNHDSPTRLEVPMPFLSAFDMVVIGQVTRQHQQIDVERMVIPLKNRQGEVKAWCLAIPFLRPSDVPKVDNAKDAYLEGIAALYQQATDCALDKRETGQAIIAMGHCHMLGSQVSEDSERKLVMGGIESLSSAIFAPEISYVALGHLHLAQKVGGDDRVRYSGTPLPMSFSEEHYQHSIRVIELENDVIKSATSILIPRTVPLYRIPKSKAEPLDAVLTLLQQHDWPTIPEQQQPYLLVRVQLEKPEPSLRQQIEQALANKSVKLIKIETTYPSTTTDNEDKVMSLEDVQRLQPEDVFLKMYQQKFATLPSLELLGAFRDLIIQNNTGGV
ncbi:MAG: exonuclease subunit SbcD [Pseudomonadota bacterium]